MCFPAYIWGAHLLPWENNCPAQLALTILACKLSQDSHYLAPALPVPTLLRLLRALRISPQVAPRACILLSRSAHISSSRTSRLTFLVALCASHVKSRFALAFFSYAPRISLQVALRHVSSLTRFFGPLSSKEILESMRVRSGSFTAYMRLEALPFGMVICKIDIFRAPSSLGLSPR